MLRPILLSAALVAGLSGCARLADSWINPANWFRGSQEVRTEDGALRPLVPPGALAPAPDARVLVDRVEALRIDRTPQGALVVAVGTVPTQGFFNAELVPVGQSGGTLVLEFRVEAPAGFEATGTPATRRITAAYDLDRASLAAIRTVRVVGAGNARESRR